VKKIYILLLIISLSFIFISCTKEANENIENELNETVDTLDENDNKEAEDIELDYMVKWVDIEFEKAVRIAINKPRGPICRSDLDGITKLEIWGKSLIGMFFIVKTLI